MAKNMKIRKGKDGSYYPYTSPDLVIGSDGKNVTTRFKELEDNQIILIEDGTTTGVKDTEYDTLNTTDKTIIGAINEVFQNVSNGKQLIATAITDKGINTSSDDTFQTMANNIGKISGVDGVIVEINNVKYKLTKTTDGNIIATKIKHTITNNLSNAINSNIATEIDDNVSYTANISADSGYKLKTVTVTMGGTNITNTVYSSGVITIPSVTGNIIITVTTEVDTDNTVGSVDSNNNISLTGLDADTYTLKYEDDNGVLADFDTIATMEVV